MEHVFDCDMNKILEKLCKKSKAVGANVALFDNEKILYSYNYGYINNEQKIKSTNDSLYMIGSNTKVMTALGIFKLMEDGLLSLEDDIRKFIPEFEIKTTFDYDKITVEHLLMHRSGLQSDLYNIILDNTRDYHEVVEELKHTYLTSEPGVMFSYSNVGYGMLGLIIERASGLRYPEYIKKIIAEPLGIQIHFLQTEQERAPYTADLSLCYNKKGQAVEDYVSTILSAGSNTYISLNDFVKFGQIFLKKDDTIFKKETLEKMEILNVRESLDHELLMVGYGLVHNYYDYGPTVPKVLGHDGGTAFHYSIMNYIPSLHIGVAVVTNSERARGLFTVLGDKVMTEYLKKKGLIHGDLPLEHKHVQANCEQYLGRFATQLGVAHIRKNKKNELVAKLSNFNVRLMPCEDGFLQLYPKGIRMRLPAVRKLLKRLRMKLVDYEGEEVLVVEQTTGSHKQAMIFGGRYKETTIPKSFAKACGNYKAVSDPMKNLGLKGFLRLEKDSLLVMTIELKALNAKFTSCLKVEDDNLAFLQGFGRNARQSVLLHEENGEIHLTCSGIVLKRI